MIEYKFKDPAAFDNDEWKVLSFYQWKHHAFLFDRYEYRLFSVIYDKDTTEFREAVSKEEMWKTMQKRAR